MILSLRFLPVALLLGVAVWQLVLAFTANLSPWSGGGFGMFSTTDSPSHRHLRVVGTFDFVELEMASDEVPRTAGLHARILPDEDRIRALAEEMADTQHPDWGWPSSLDVQVYRTHFDPETLASESEMIGRLEVPLDGE